MLLNMRDKETDGLVSRDYLDLNMSLSVERLEDGKYCVDLNNKYRTYDTFSTQEKAERYLKEISSTRNQLEEELRAYV